MSNSADRCSLSAVSLNGVSCLLAASVAFVFFLRVFLGYFGFGASL